ncbi:MAG: ketopantoate reductase family protein [Acidilobus sp.]
MRVGVVGCGAVGTALSVALAMGGASVYAVSRKAKGCRRVRASFKGFGEADVTLCGWQEAPKDLDVLVIATKAYDVADAVNAAISSRVSARLAVSVQNGLGSLELIESAFPSAAGALIYFGSARTGECQATYTGGRKVIIGCRLSCDRDALAGFAEALRSGGLDVETVGPAEFEGHRWLKLAVNSAINPLTLITWSKNGAIVRDPALREAASAIAEETWRVAKALNIAVPEDPVEATIRTASETAENCSSTVQDVAEGRRTELEFINMAVWERSTRLSFRAALNLLAYLAAEAASRWQRGRRSPCEG